MGVPWVGCNEGCGERTVGGNVSTGPAPPQWLGIWGNVQMYLRRSLFHFRVHYYQGSIKLMAGEGSHSGLALRQRGFIFKFNA